MGALISLSAIVGIIVGISLATTHDSKTTGNVAAASTASATVSTVASASLPPAQLSVAPAPPSSSPPDPAVTVCQTFNKIYPDLSARLSADANNPSALSPDRTLDSYANDLAHWTYVVNQAVDSGTTSATVQFANDLGNAGIATVQVAEPLPGVTPDVQSAIADVDTVQGDCSALMG